MNVNQALDEFLAEEHSQGRAPTTVLFHRRLLTPLVTFLEERDRTDVASLGSSDMRGFFGHLYARSEAGEITRATVAAFDRSVRAFCSFCVQEKLLPENPMKGRPRARPPRSLPDTLTFDEIHALLNACGEDPMGRRDRALMLLMLDTGLRAGEVCALKAADLVLAGDHGRVRVRAENSKDREERTVPVSAETVKALRRYLEDRPAQAQALFVSVAAGTRKLSADRLSGSGLNQLMRRRGEQADVVGKRKWCHIWRHTFGKDYVLAGGDLETLRRLLGHSNLETVRIYLGFRTEEVEACHFKFSPVRQLVALS